MSAAPEIALYSGGSPLGISPLGDRKSTRLNSSHDQISYAVFCLKKKKNTKRQDCMPNTMRINTPSLTIIHYLLPFNALASHIKYSPPLTSAVHITQRHAIYSLICNIIVDQSE